jgi:hypothetical protein
MVGTFPSLCDPQTLKSGRRRTERLLCGTTTNEQVCGHLGRLPKTTGGHFEGPQGLFLPGQRIISIGNV